MNQNNNNMQINQPPEKVRITAKDFAAKYKSKREVYNFLSVDCGIYLPAYGKWSLPSVPMSIFLFSRASQHLLPEGHH